MFVATVGLFLIDDGSGVFDDAGAFRDGRGGVAAGGVDEGGTNDEAHTYIGSRTWSIAAGHIEFFRIGPNSPTQTGAKTSRIVRMVCSKESRRRLPMLVAALLFCKRVSRGGNRAARALRLMLRPQTLRSSRLSLHLQPRQSRRSRRVPQSRERNPRPIPIRPPAIRFPWRSRKRRRRQMHNRTAPQSDRANAKQFVSESRRATARDNEIQVENPDNPHRQKTIRFPKRNRKRRRRQTTIRQAKQVRKFSGIWNSQPGAAASSKGGYSSSDAHLPEPEVGAGKSRDASEAGFLYPRSESGWTSRGRPEYRRSLHEKWELSRRIFALSGCAAV